MSDTKTIQILYNSCYGGWCPSKKAIDLYNVRMTGINPNFKNIDKYSIDNVSRHDPILVEVYNELKEEFDYGEGEKYSKTELETIPAKYTNYYVICEYDGLENVSIDTTTYKMCTMTDEINEKLELNIANDEKKINMLTEYMNKKKGLDG